MRPTGHRAFPLGAGALLAATFLLPDGAHGQDGGMIIGGPFSDSILPGRDGGMVIGGPLEGSILPVSNGGVVIAGHKTSEVGSYRRQTEATGA